MRTNDLSKSKLARSIALGLTLGTSLYWGGVANAATEYDAATISGDGGSSATVSYYYTTGDGSTIPYVYTNYNTVTSSVTAISDQSQVVIKAGAQNYKNTGSGVLTVSASNATLNLVNASISNGIYVSGSANNITIGANTNTITFSGSGVDTNNITVSNNNGTNITDAKSLSVTQYASVGNVNSTAGDVSIAAGATVGNVDNTTGSVTVNGTTTNNSTTGHIATTGGEVSLSGVKTDYVTVTGSNVDVKNNSAVKSTDTTSDGISYTGYTAANPISKSTTGGSVTVSGTSSVTGAQNGINYTNGNVTATGTSITQTAKVIGTGANGIANTSGQVSLGYATVTGAINGISATAADVDIIGSTVTGGINGISGTTGNVSITNTTVTGTTGAGITDTAGTNGITLTNATITGNGGAGIANTTAGGVTQTTGNSVISGSTYGITTTQNSVSLSGTDKTLSTVTGVQGGIYGTSGSVILNNETVKSTTSGDAINGTGGEVAISNSDIEGAANGISTTTGNVSITSTTVTGTTGAGITDTAGTNGVTLTNATITGKGGAGIANTTVGGVTQTTGNSVISGSTYGIITTKGSVSLTGTAKTLSTVTGVQGGIYGTEGSVILNNETVKSTDSGDAINGTGGEIAISNSDIEGAANGISTTTGNVSITNTTVTGTKGAGITDTAGTNGVTLTNATITGKEGAGIANTTVGGVTQTTGNSVISGSTYGITTTKNSVSLSGTDKTLSTVTGVQGGIYGTGGSVTLNNETVKSTTSGDAINSTGGEIAISNSDIEGAANGINTTTGNVSISNTTVTGNAGAGITDTAGANGVTIANATVTGKGGAGIANTTGGGVTQTANSVISGTTYGIYKTAGTVSLTSTDKTKSTVTGGTGGIYATTGDVRLTNEIVTATTGDGIKGVDGVINLSNTDISATGTDGNGITAAATIDGVEYKQTGLVNIANSTVTATNNGIDLTNSNGGKVTITDTTVTATKGFGIDATSHKDVTISGVSVTAGTKGIVDTTAGSTLNVNTDNTNHSIVAGNVGVEIGGQGSNAYYNGTDALSVEITNGGDEHTNAGIYAHDGATSNNPSMATTITIDGTTGGAKASGLIATGGSKVIFSNANNVIKTATTEGTSVDNVDGAYVAGANSSVAMDGGSIDISGVISANGVHAVNGGTASFSNQGDNFSVAATDTGTANGVLADGIGTSVVIKNTNLKNLSSVDGNVTGLNASAFAQIKVSFTAEDTTSKDINVHATGTGSATAINAVTGADVSVTGIKGIFATADGIGTATGIYTNGTDSTVTVNTATDKDMGALNATSMNGEACGIIAESGGVNKVYGLTTVDVSGETGATGIRADNNNTSNTVTMSSNLTVTNKGTGVAFGIFANDGGINTVEGVTDITADNKGTGDVYAIFAQTSGSTNNVNETITNVTNDNEQGSITATSTTAKAYGILSQTNGVNVVGGVTSVTVTGSTGVYGISANVGTDGKVSNTVYMDDALTATTVTGEAYGIQATTQGSNKVEGVTDIKAEATTSGNVYGIGASANSSNDVTMAGALSATTTTGDASGIIATDRSINTVNGVTGVEANTTTGDARGIYALDSENKVTGNEEAAVSATTTTGEADGIVAKSTGTQAALNTVTGITSVTASGSTDAYGIGASANSSNDVTMSGDVAATSTAKGTVVGIGAFTYGTNVVKGAADVTASGVEGDVYGIGASANSSNDVTMTGALSAKVTESGNVYAVQATDSGANYIMGTKSISATTKFGDAYGINAVKNSINEVNKGVTTAMGSLTVASENGAAYGVNADATDGTDITANNVGGLTTIVVTSTTSAYGVKADGANSVNTIVMDGTLTATGGSGTTTAVTASNGGTDTITGVTSISAKSAGTGAVNGIVADNGTVKVYQADGTSPVAITAESTGSGNVKGVYANDNSTIENISDVTATANSGNAYGVYLDDGTNTIKTINNIKATTTSGDETYGIYADGNGAETAINTLEVKGNITATNESGQDAGGVYNYYNKSLTVTVDGNVTAEAPSGTAYLVRSWAGGATTDVTVNGNLSATGNSAILAYSEWGDTLTLTGSDSSTTTLKGTSEAMAAKVVDQSTINLKNITVKVEGLADTSYSVYSNSNDDDDEYGHGGGSVNLINTTITGNGANGGADIYYANGYSNPDENLNVTIDSASSITGKAKVNEDDANYGAIKIENAGTWNITGNSDLNLAGTSELANTGLVDMTKDGSTAEKQVSSTLSVNKLEHDGNLIMDVSPEKVTTGDQIVTNSTSGNGKIQANILNKETDATYKEFLDTALITATGTADGNYSVTNNGDNNLEVGNWTYSLKPMKQADGSTIYHLVNNDLLSNKGKTIVSSVVSPDYWYYETSALYNDINNFNGGRKDYDVWAHVVHSKNTRTDVWDGKGVGDVDSQYNGVVVGIDKKFSQTTKGNFWGGIMGGYGKVSNDFVGGDADMNSAHVGIYGVYRTNTDWYVGSILKYNRYSTDLSSTTAAGITGGVRTSDDLSQTGWGLSVIGGKRFTNNKGWFVEPQLELGYHKISDGDYTLGGSHVNVDSMTSKRIRAGFNVGKTIAYQSGAKLDVFAQASLIHEFGGDGQITTYNKYYPDNGTDTLQTKFDGTWGLYKFGLNYNIAKGNNGILALTYNKGSHRSSPVGFEITYNWTF